MLLKENVENGYEGQRLEGLILVGNYSKLPTKNGKSYIGGSVEGIGTIPFKAWGNSDAFRELDAKSYAGKIARVSASVNIYNGSRSIVIDDIMLVNEDEIEYSKSDFLVTKYNAESYLKSMRQMLAKASDKCLVVFDEIVDGDVKERFMNEFAAIHHHDNCRSGLLAHSTKVTRIASLIGLYPNIIKKVPVDILYLSAALHDIGKVFEYDNGTISDKGKVLSHTMLGVLEIEKHRETIIDILGEEYYYLLLSVIQQHHGEYGERPRSIVAYVVHLLDMLDTKLTGLDEALSQQNEGIVFDEYKLN